jgi:hypothetical protein
MVADLRHVVFSLLRKREGTTKLDFGVLSCIRFFGFSRQQSENTTEGGRDYDT